jgi:putative ABC transport system permease protein
MFRNYLTIAFRKLLKNKAQSFINIGGLSVGMAVAMIIGFWIWDELSFDKYHENYDRIAQVMQQRTNYGVVNTGVAIPWTLDAALRKNYGTDFKHIVLASWTDHHILAAGDKRISWLGDFMGSEGPEMFSLRMLKGTRKGLEDPSSILISKSVAIALFAGTDPMGQQVKFDNKASLKVTGVYEDLPNNTTLHEVAFIAPWAYYVTAHDWVKKAAYNWSESSFQLYVQVADNANMGKVSEKIRDIKLKNVNKEDAKYNPVIFLHPMNKWHLYGEFKNGINTGGAIEYVWLFGIIGVFVLLLACINFMNLSTAHSEKRAKEVGIRKTMGSLRTQLIRQFFSESLLTAASAFAISLLLMAQVLPFFNEVSNKKMSVPWFNPVFWVMGMSFTLFTGLIAGSYPAFYLSSFKPVKVLKGSFKAGRFAAIPRKVLVVVQFTISVILIIGTIIVFKQIQYAKNRPLGYERNGLIVMASTDDLDEHFDAVKADILRSGVITKMAASSSPMTEIHNSRSDVYWKEKDPTTTYDFENIYVMSEYGKTVGWQLTAGRDFDSQMLTDSSAVILNEVAVKYMGLKNPIGEIIRFSNKDYQVIGVTKDMVMQSPYEPVKQTIFYVGNKGFDYIVFKINPNTSVHEALGKIEKVCKTYSPSVPFSFNFADEEYSKKFFNEERIGKLASSFACLAIFISCLGLFGMASFSAEQRIKEIGVRKVLGASVFNLWRLMSKEFMLLVIISLLIATPIAYYIMYNWLKNYEYHSDMTWWIFAFTGLGAMMITLLTVSWQAIKAAIANPAKSLRTE